MRCHPARVACHAVRKLGWPAALALHATPTNTPTPSAQMHPLALPAHRCPRTRYACFAHPNTAHMPMRAHDPPCARRGMSGDVLGTV